MKLIALFVARCSGGCESPVIFLSYAFELSSYAFYQRGTVKEGCKFLARIAIPRVSPTAREVITHEGSLAFVRRFLDSLAVVAIADESYPPRLGFQLLQETYDKFRRAVPDAEWTRVTSESGTSQIKFKQTLSDILRKYQDPRAIDQTTVALEKTENAQVEVRRTINALLRNGEDLSQLVQKSEDLSLSSKQLFKSAKKARSHYACCSVQ